MRRRLLARRAWRHADRSANALGLSSGIRPFRPAGLPQPPSRRPPYVAEVLTHARAETLTDFVAAVVPAALPDHAGRLLIAAAAAPPIPDWLTPFPRTRAAAASRKRASSARSRAWKGVRSRWMPRPAMPCRRCSTIPRRLRRRCRSWGSGDQVPRGAGDQQHTGAKVNGEKRLGGLDALRTNPHSRNR